MDINKIMILFIGLTILFSIPVIADTPNNYNIKFNQNYVNFENQDNILFTISSATPEDKHIYNYTIYDSASPSISTSATGTFQSASYTIYNINLTKLGKGILTLETILSNDENNIEDVATATITKDTIPPTLNIISPVDGEIYDESSVLIHFNATDENGIDSIWYINESGETYYSSSETINKLELELNDGSYTYEFYANDTNGNIASENINFEINTSSPVITEPNNPPSISGLPNKSFTKGQNYDNIFDLDDYSEEQYEDELSYSIISQNRAIADCSIDPNNQIDCQASSTGISDVTVKVSDGYQNDEDIFTIIVSSENSGIITLGGSDTKASNYDYDDDESDWNTYDDTTYTLTPSNSGTMICSVKTEDKFISKPEKSKNNINITLDSNNQGTYSVSEGEPVEINIKGRIPENLDAINPSSFEKTSPKVGTIECKVGNFNHNIEVYMQRKAMLELKDLEATIGLNTYNIDDDDKIDEIKPGDIIDLETFVENNYDDDDDLEINVEFDIECDNDIDTDGNDDIDLDSNSEDSNIFELIFEEDDVRDKTYDCIIQIKAKDQHGAFHGIKRTVSFEVERNSYEVVIKEFEIKPSTLRCQDMSANGYVKIKNIGKKDDDEIKLEINSVNLDIDETLNDIDLDESTSIRKQFQIMLPENTEPGTYSVYANAYSRSDELTSREIIKLTVPDCSPEEEKEEEEEEEEVIVTLLPEQNQQYTTQNTEPLIPEQEKSNSETRNSITFMDERAIIVTLVILSIILMGAITFMIAYIIIK